VTPISVRIDSTLSPRPGWFLTTMGAGWLPGIFAKWLFGPFMQYRLPENLCPHWRHTPSPLQQLVGRGVGKKVTVITSGWGDKAPVELKQGVSRPKQTH
jgi:hypothetical protein